jgi:hypothetical protein
MLSRVLLAALMLAGGAWSATADLQLSRDGATRYLIVHGVDAAAPEVNAARELASHLRAVTGVEFRVEALAGDVVPRRAIVVGPGAMARRAFPDVPWEALGDEEIVIRTRGSRLLLAGGRPRGTLYAVSRFL